MPTADGHLLTLIRMVTYGLDDPIPIPIECPGDDRDIGLLNLPCLKLRTELVVHLVGLGYQYHSARLAVQAMDDPRSRRTTRVAQLLEMMSQSRRECPRPMALGRMDHHPRGLVDRDDRFVLIQNIQSDRFGNRTVLRRRRQIVDLDLLARNHMKGWLDLPTIDPHKPLHDHPPQKNAAVAIDLQRQIQIDPQVRMLWLDGKDQPLESLLDPNISGWILETDVPVYSRQFLGRWWNGAYIACGYGWI